MLLDHTLLGHVGGGKWPGDEAKTTPCTLFFLTITFHCAFFCCDSEAAQCLQIHLCTIRRGIQLIVYTIITTKSVLLFSLCLWLELMVVLCTLLQIFSAVLLVNKIISISCRRSSLVPNVLYVIRKYAKILRRCLGIAIIRGSVLPFTDMEWLPWEGFFSRNAAVTNRKVDDGKGDLLPGSTLIKFYWTCDCVCDVVIIFISVCICKVKWGISE